MEPIKTRLAKYLIKSSNPIDLFNEWYEHVKDKLPFTYTNGMGIATVNVNGKVSNRTVILRNIQDGCFFFNTVTYGQKHKDLNDKSSLAATFLWYCRDDTAQCDVSRQIRIEGSAELMPKDFTKHYFDTGATYKLKELYAFCKQGETIEEWNDYEQRHSVFNKTAIATSTIECPDSLVFYKIVPVKMEFYYGPDDDVTLPDRIQFNKDANGEWNYKRLEP